MPRQRRISRAGRHASSEDPPRFACGRSGGDTSFLAGLLCGFILFATLPGLAAENGPPKPATAEVEAGAQAFWREAQDELFAGFTLSDEQQAGIDALLAEAARDRARGRELTVIATSPETDPEHRMATRAELRKLRKKLQNPDWRFDAMRELLTEEQRTTFDRNRRLRSDRRFASAKRRHENAKGE